jgi:hypothetical protein
MENLARGTVYHTNEKSRKVSVFSEVTLLPCCSRNIRGMKGHLPLPAALVIGPLVGYTEMVI